MCFPISRLLSFHPFLPRLHLASMGTGLFAHIKRSRWLVTEADSEEEATLVQSQQENGLERSQR